MIKAGSHKAVPLLEKIYDHNKRIKDAVLKYISAHTQDSSSDPLLNITVSSDKKVFIICDEQEQYYYFANPIKITAATDDTRITELSEKICSIYSELIGLSDKTAEQM